MQYRRLGNSNLKVSVLCLGTIMFGKQTPFEENAAHCPHKHLLGPSGNL